MGIADNGDMAVILKHRYLGSWLQRGTLARLPVDGGHPRPILEDVYTADISRDGKEFAIVRGVGSKQRLDSLLGRCCLRPWDGSATCGSPPTARKLLFLSTRSFPMIRGELWWWTCRAITEP